MKTTTSNSAAAEIFALRRFSGPAREFWPRYAAAAADLVDADRCLIAVKAGVEGATWRKLHDWAHNEIPTGANQVFSAKVLELAELGVAEEMAVRSLGTTGAWAMAMRLALPKSAETWVMLVLKASGKEEEIREAMARLQLAADVPSSYQQALQAQQAAGETQKSNLALEILAQFHEQSRFEPACLALANALATRFECDRVSVGWMHGANIRLRSVSRMEKFDRQRVAAQGLEAVMEEAVDQQADLVYPPEKESPHVTRDHERYATDQRAPFLASFPLTLGDRVVGCVTAERGGRAFLETETGPMRLALDFASRRLADLQAHDRWVGARCAAWVREKAAGFLGWKNTWAKLAGIGVFVLALVLVLVKLPYRVEANFVLRADRLAYVTSPFDGYLREVWVRPGDRVTNGQPLLRFDTRDLLLEEETARSELLRYQREMEKARASRALAEMRIAEAQASQSRARLDLIRHRLEQSTLRAPFDSVVVEGDLRDRLGAPAKQGDALIRLARLDGMYVEAEVPERDIHEVTSTGKGEVAFFSQPKFVFPIQGEAIEPAAQSKEGGNVFRFRCRLAQPAAEWFRPGMSGLAKLEAGDRRLIWILTHRTVDVLRMWLWW